MPDSVSRTELGPSVTKELSLITRRTVDVPVFTHDELAAVLRALVFDTDLHRYNQLRGRMAFDGWLSSITPEKRAAYAAQTVDLLYEFGDPLQLQGTTFAIETGRVGLDWKDRHFILFSGTTHMVVTLPA